MSILVRTVVLGSGFLLGGCFASLTHSRGKVSSPSTELSIAQPTYASAKKNVSSYDPGSAAATQLAGPSGALSHTSITFPAGALSIATELVIEEAAPLSETSVASSLGLRSDLTVTPIIQRFTITG